MHPRYGWNGTVSRVFPLIALIALGAFFHSTPGSAQKPTFWQDVGGALKVREKKVPVQFSAPKLGAL